MMRYNFHLGEVLRQYSNLNPPSWVATGLLHRGKRKIPESKFDPTFQSWPPEVIV